MNIPCTSFHFLYIPANINQRSHKSAATATLWFITLAATRVSERAEFAIRVLQASNPIALSTRQGQPAPLAALAALRPTIPLFASVLPNSTSSFVHILDCKGLCQRVRCADLEVGGSLDGGNGGAEKSDQCCRELHSDSKKRFSRSVHRERLCTKSCPCWQNQDKNERERLTLSKASEL